MMNFFTTHTMPQRKTDTRVALSALFIALLASIVGSNASTVSAQEVQVSGPLKDAPAVRHMRLFREGRLQLFPQIGFTLQDEYSRSIMLGGQATYHFTDWIGLGVWGAYGIVKTDTDLTDKVKARGQTTARNVLSLPNAANFPKQVGRINWMGALQANFVPLRGKLSLFQDIFLDTDFYIFGGVAAVGLKERANDNGICDDNATADLGGAVSACSANQTKTASRTLVAPTFGVGLTLYGQDWFGIAFEWRALPFSWNTSGTDEGGLDKNGNPNSSGQFPDGQINSADRVFHFNHMISIGAVFYLPTATKITK